MKYKCKSLPSFFFVIYELIIFKELNKISETHAAHTNMFAKKEDHVVKPAYNSMVDYSNADNVIRSLGR